MERITIDDRLENAASYGEMDMDLFIWKSSIGRLRKNGLIVTEKYPTQRRGEYYCNVSWSHASEVSEDEKPNQANHLYAIAKEAQK